MNQVKITAQFWYGMRAYKVTVNAWEHKGVLEKSEIVSLTSGDDVNEILVTDIENNEDFENTMVEAIIMAWSDMKTEENAFNGQRLQS